MKMIEEYRTLLDYREDVKHLLEGIEVGVTIGGSYGLKYHYDFFDFREVHDYDIIITGEKTELEKAYKRLSYSLRMVNPEWANHSNYYYTHKRLVLSKNINGKKAEALFTEDKIGPWIFEPSRRTVKAKVDYTRYYIRHGIMPRPKDIEDMALAIADSVGWTPKKDITLSQALVCWTKVFDCGKCEVSKVLPIFMRMAEITAAVFDNPANTKAKMYSLKDVNPIEVYCSFIGTMHSLRRFWK